MPTGALLHGHVTGFLPSLFCYSFLPCTRHLASSRCPVYQTTDSLTSCFSFILGNTQYTLFFSNDGDGMVDLYLRNADSDQVKGIWTATRQSGALKLLVNDTWWDNRAVDLWTGQPRNWTFYWVIVPSGTVLNGGEVHQPTFTVVQTALPNYAISSSSASMESASMNSASRSLASEDAAASLSKALQNNPTQSNGGNDFPAWAIALVVVLGVVTLTCILSLVFVLQRYLRRKQRMDDRRNSMGSDSPMMATAAADPSSPITHESSYTGHQAALPTLVRSPPSIHHDISSVHSKGTAADPMISTNEAAYMADAFRKALRRPDFTDGPQEEGESPENNGVQTEQQLLKSELAGEGRDIRSVGSERGVKVVTDEEGDKSQ